jgi:tetratricopeptide (TPR) repeat protein
VLVTVIVRLSIATLLTVLAFLSGAPALAQAPAAADADQLIARALELQKSGDFIGAIDTYKTALALAPDRADAMSNLGAAYVRMGQYDDAVREYEAALKVDPTNSTIRLNLGLAYYKSARPDQAIQQLKRVVASDPDAKNAYLVLADCYLQTGQDQEVIALLRPREQLFGNDLAFAYILGTALLHTDNVTDGQRYVDRVFGAGESAEAHLLMGMAYLSQRDYPSAKTELERAVKLNPKLPTVHSTYGRSLLGLADQEGADREFRAELALNINDFEANLQLGNIRRNTQKFDEASAYLERAASIRPTDITTRKLLATVRLQTGKTEEAVAMLEQIVKEAPSLVDAHVQLATGYNRLKRKADADRERVIIDKLNAENQAKQPGAKGGDSDQ